MSESLPSYVQPYDGMGDARHPRPYPEGPRRQMTPEWKQLVRDTLADNKKAEPRRVPFDQAGLARAIGVHKTAITKMFAADASALVDLICSVLGIPQPMRPANPDDELDATIDALDPDERAKVLKFIRDFVLSG